MTTPNVTQPDKCPKCGQALPPKSDLPEAHYLRALVFCGRQVFWVEGHPGLWGTGPYPGDDGERLYCHVDQGGRGHPASKTKTLYRLAEISDEVAKAFQQEDMKP